MKFPDWRTLFAPKHISAEMQELLDELKEVEQYEVEAMTDDMKLRFEELKEFAQSIEHMLIAEWKWFVYQLEGHGSYTVG